MASIAMFLTHTITLFISGEIVNYLYDTENKILLKSMVNYFKSGKSFYLKKTFSL